mmetsp:Transcript_34111/g.102806  ORF Transcript_34111/g.102806 Transcript_34111/m.102806 type:complete len:146 (+) Transcript_34111:219-656(+)
MGTSKRPKAAAPAKAATTVSKRAAKKGPRRKVASKARAAALVGRLEETAAADAAKRRPDRRFRADGLFEAIEEIAAAAPARRKNLPGTRTNKGKRRVEEEEAERLEAVLAHPAFVADPLGAVLQHLNATLPPAAVAEPARRKKKR